MKNIGLYALLFGNSSQKTTWKQYGFDRMDEQLNVVFAVMLYLMEQSLKKENCLLDDIGAYLDTLNTSSFEKPMSYETAAGWAILLSMWFCPTMGGRCILTVMILKSGNICICISAIFPMRSYIWILG